MATDTKPTIEAVRRILAAVPEDRRCSDTCPGWVISESDQYGTQIEKCDQCVGHALYDDDVAQLPEAQAALARATEIRSLPCLAQLGCLCRAHAAGAASDQPCDATEPDPGDRCTLMCTRPDGHDGACSTDDDGDHDGEVCCAVCGSLNVQYAVWYSPNTGQTHDVFGSWNAGDNTFCSDCDAEGRDPNAPLLDASDAAEYTRLRELRARIDGGEDPDVVIPQPPDNINPYA